MKGLYAIVGMQHRPGAAAKLATLKQGSPLLLIREPDNQYDRNAVQVWSQQATLLEPDPPVLLGYIKGNQVAPLARMIDSPAWRADDPARSAVALDGNIKAAVRAVLSVDGGRWLMAELDE